MDKEISKEFQKILIKQGINFKLESKVISVKKSKTGVQVDYVNNKTGNQEKIDCEKVLVSVGRKAYTEGLNLSKVGVKKDNKGSIEVNKKFQSSVPNIYAIGDVIKGPMLAHKAEEGRALLQKYCRTSRSCQL